MLTRTCGNGPALLFMGSLLSTPLPVVAHAQPRPETVPELMASGVPRIIYGLPSGTSPTVDELLADADIVVKATVGDSLRAGLSPDERHVYTIYSLVDPVVLFQSKLLTAATPGITTVTVAQLGGSVKSGGAEFTYSRRGLPPLKSGMKAIFILKMRDDGHYHLAHTFFGALVIRNDVVTPLVQSDDFATEYRGASVSQVMTDLAARLARARLGDTTEMRDRRERVP